MVVRHAQMAETDLFISAILHGWLRGACSNHDILWFKFCILLASRENWASGRWDRPCVRGVLRNGDSMFPGVPVCQAARRNASEQDLRGMG